MASVVSRLRAHAAPIYFTLVLVLSWGGAYLVLSPTRFPPPADQFTNLGLPFYLAVLAGPSIAGLAMTVLAQGRPGLRALRARLGHGRIAWGWYALALVPALSVAVATLLLAMVSRDLRPAITAVDDRGALLAATLGSSLLVGFLEELGWSGFAAPHLRARHSILATGLIIGVVWGLWHFPLFWEADSFQGTLPFTVLLARLFGWLPPFRVLLTWMLERTGSLPAVMLTHAAVAFASIVLAPTGASGPALLIGPLVSAAIMWLLVGLSFGSRRLEHRPLQARTA